MFLDGQLALVDNMLHYFDRMSMAASLEVRVPFLDHHVVEYCAGIPAELKVRRLTYEVPAESAARGSCPTGSSTSARSASSPLSVDGWFRDQAGGAIAEYLLHSLSRTRRVSLTGRASATSFAGHARSA